MKRLAHQSSPNKMTVTNVVPLDAEMGENQVRRVGGIIPLSLSLSLSFTRTLSRTDARTHASVAINGDPALSACAFRQQKHQKKKKKTLFYILQTAATATSRRLARSLTHKPTFPPSFEPRTSLVAETENARHLQGHLLLFRCSWDGPRSGDPRLTSASSRKTLSR